MTDYPLPSIPGLPADNTVDLDELGSDGLLTYIKYPGMAEGDMLFPNWRGCALDGGAHDRVVELPVGTRAGYDPVLGMPFPIPNTLMVALDQGWALYSYAVMPVGSAERGPESLRRFVYIGKRAAPLLPVAQMPDSHDLALDPDSVGQNMAVLIPPYQAMQAGDKVTLQWQGYYNGQPEQPYSTSKTLVAADVGRPLKFTVPGGELAWIEGGHAEIGYRIDYAGQSLSSTSARQSIAIVPPATPRLPALRVVGHDAAEPIDPGLFRDGLTLRIDAWPDIRDGDQLLLHWLGARDNTSVSKSLRADTSSVDSGFLVVHLEPEWLEANQGETVSVFYQFARAGAGLSGEALRLEIRTRLDLQPPLVERATVEGDAGEFKGVLLATNAREGAYVTLPSALPVGPNDVYEVHWQGHEQGGRHVATEPVSADDKKRFFIPASAIAANMAVGEVKRFPVFYRLLGEGRAAQDSEAFNLRIEPLAQSAYPTTQCKQAQGNSTLSLANIPTGGADITLIKWVFIAAGQLLHLEVTGVDKNNQAVTLPVRGGTPVTAAEVAKGSIEAKAYRIFFQNLKPNSNLRLKARVSFDGGDSWTQFPDAEIKITA